jgi:hypothetical protein
MVVAINRNGWSQSIGTAGRDHPVRAVKSCPSEIQRVAAHFCVKTCAGFRSHAHNDDLNEVFRMATHVLCLENGKITRNGKPEDVFSDNSISGKVQITGKIARIDPQDTINIVTVISGNNQIIKVIAFDSDLENLKIGDQVMVFSKAFNPIISKLG